MERTNFHPLPPSAPPGPASERVVLGRITFFTGVLLVVAGVLAIRVLHQPLRIDTMPSWSSEMLKIAGNWSNHLDMPPITLWAMAVIAIGCGLGFVALKLSTVGRTAQTRTPMVGLLNTPLRLLILSAGASALAVGFFVCATVVGFSSTRVVLPWLALVAAVGIALLLSDRRDGRPLLPQLGRWELAGLVAAMVVAFATCGAISSSWRFSFIGDEYAFFDFARGIAHDGLMSSNWLDGMGVYKDNPKLMSVYQAAWMVLLGPSSLAWRLSATFLTVICLPPLYLSLRHLIGRSGGPARSAAVVGCIVFFSSESIIVWAVQGKIHVAALPSLVFGLCLFFAARARANPLLYWLSGVACGASFHISLLGAAIAVPTIGLLVGIDTLRQFIRVQRPSLRILAPCLLFTAGVVIIAAPYLVQIDDLRGAADAKMVHYEGIDGFSARIRGATIGLLMPLSFNASGHFLWGNVVDPISAILVGMALMPVAWRRVEGLLQALIVLTTSALMTSGLSQYTYPSVTRTFLIMVPVAMLASLGFSTIAGLGPRAPGRRRVVAAGLCLMVGSTVAIFNWVKLWHFNPYQRNQSWHMLAMKEIENASPENPVAVVFPHADPNSYLLEKIVEIYGYDDRILHVVDDTEGLNDLSRLLGMTDLRLVLARTKPDSSEDLVDLCASHQVPLRFIDRGKASPPEWSPGMETAVSIITRLERRRPDLS